MKDIRNYIWVLILISGIVLLISFFTPVTFSIQPLSQSYTWLWGLRYYNVGGIDSNLSFWFLSESSYFSFDLAQGLLNIMIAVIIFIGSLKLIIMGNNLRIGNINIKEKEKELVKIGGLMVLAPIIYVTSKYIFGSLTLLLLGVERSYVLWAGARYPGFAFIGPFIGGALVFISVIASKKIKPLTKTPVVAKIGRLNFCPECGKQISSKEGKFCIHCGFEIKHKNEVNNAL